MKKDKLNIALIGCGRISKSHLKAINKLESECNLIAICDENLERLNSTNEFFTKDLNPNDSNLKRPFLFQNFELLLDQHNNELIDIDLIVLATPSGLHPTQTIAAAKQKINICTEKPMAINYQDGIKMCKVCKENGVKLFVVKQNRLNETLIDLKNKVKTNMFGKIALIELNVFWQRPQSYYDKDSWRGTLKLDGGALMNQASHYVDLLEWIGGPLESLNANIATIGRNIEAEDTAVLTLKWKNGALGTMAVTMLTYPKNIEGSITIIGDKGSAKIGGVALNKYEYFYFEEDINEEEMLKANYEPQNVYGSGHYKYYENMINSLKNIEDPICDGESGLSSIKIINAAYKSNKENKVIRLI